MPSLLRLFVLVGFPVVIAACGGGDSSQTPPPPALKVVAAGDIADCTGVAPSASAAAGTAALVAADDTLVLTLGDTTYPVGAPEEFATCYHPTWGSLKARTRPVPGNHDYMTAGADGYFGYFGTLAGPDRRGWYSFDAGGWHFIALDSNVDADAASAQAQWLAGDLAASRDALCTLAYWHHPVFSSGPHGDNAKMAGVFAMLHAAGVDVVLSGHDHDYERFAPQDAHGARDEARGVRAFVVGTGGATLYPLLLPRPNSEARYAADHGVLRLQLDAEGYRWDFVRAGGGQTIDSGSARCHR